MYSIYYIGVSRREGNVSGDGRMDEGEKNNKKGLCVDINMINQLCAPEIHPTLNKGFLLLESRHRI